MVFIERLLMVAIMVAVIVGAVGAMQRMNGEEPDLMKVIDILMSHPAPAPTKP